MPTETPDPQAVQSAASNDVMNELISDAMQSSATPDAVPEPSASPEKPVEATPEAEAATATDAEGAAPAADPNAPQEVPAPSDGVPRFKFRGKEYTAEDLRNDPKLLADLATGANQQANFQSKYEKEAEERRAAEKRLQEIIELGLAQAREAQPASGQAPGSAPTQPQITPEQVTQYFANAVKQRVEQGFLPAEFVEIYPDLASQFVWFGARVEEMERREAIREERERGAAIDGERRAFHAYLESTTSAIANEHEFFSPLKDNETRAKFYQHLRKVNPQADALTPEFMKEQWIALNGQAVLEGQKATVAQEAAEAAKKRTRAQGAGSSPRPVPVPSTPLTGQAAHIADLIEGLV